MSSITRFQSARYQGINLLLSGFFVVPALAAPIGAQVLVQSWDPRHPEAQNVLMPYDNESAVSDAVTAAWGEVRDAVCGPFVQFMGQGDLLAKGITLSQIDCKVPDGEIAAKQNGQRGLKVAYRVRGVSFSAQSTTPDIALGIGLSKAADPSFKASFDLDFEVALDLQETGDLLHISDTKVVVSNSRIDSKNATGDVLKWVDDNLVPIFAGQSFRSKVEAALNGISPKFTDQANAKLVAVNQSLRPPPNLIRSGQWARPGKIYIAYAPAAWMPPANSQVSGRVSWRDADLKFNVDSCAAFPMSASVQTGPAPLIDPISRDTGTAPKRQVGQVVSTSPVATKGDNRECSYALGGLPAGIPVGIGARVAAGQKPKQGNTVNLPPMLIARGWGGRTVPDGGSGRDWEIAQGRDVSVPVQAGALVPQQKNIDPVINQTISPGLPIAGNPEFKNPSATTKTLRSPVVAPQMKVVPILKNDLKQ